MMEPLYKALKSYTMVPERTFYANLDFAAGIKNTPGCIVECGVWRGGMIAAINATMGLHRPCFLFDSFEGLPPAQEIDGEAALAYQRNIEASEYYDNCRASPRYAREAMRVVGATNYTIVKGWFSNTLPGYEFPSPIALLRLDGDWYDSTMTCLANLYDKVAPGGLVIIDDFFAWEGCRKAALEFFAPMKQPLNFNSDLGLCWMVKA